jgi:hypothetical protein
LRQAVNRLSLPPKHCRLAVLIFQWTGRRKSEVSDLRRRSEHDAYPSFVQVKRQIHLQAKSTAQSANRENSSKLAFEPDEIVSPVDLGCRIPAKCALFAQVMRESRKLKTRWRSEWDSNSRATF